jgi:MSHA pilin protein MshB
MKKFAYAKTKNSGFTIIELVVVILLLGILSATALPRFMEVTDRAHSAAVSGVLGGLSSAVALFKAQAIADGISGTAVSQFNNHVTNSFRLPLVTNTASCVNVWNNLLQGGRPTISAGAVSSPYQNTPLFGANTFEAVVSVPSCYYIYVTRGSTFSAPVIHYNSTTGDVFLDTSI